MARIHIKYRLLLSALYLFQLSSVYGSRVVFFSVPNANPIKATNDCNPKCSELRGVCIDRKCHCFDGYYGKLCEKAICRGGCLNGGFCDQPDSCACPLGFKGKQCEKPRCPGGCVNGGRCVAVLGRPKCTCPSGYEGQHCQEAVCKTWCLHNGYCVKPNICACAKGWTGSHCQSAVCFNKCENGGQCVWPQTCSCPAGYEGKQCEIKVGQVEERKSKQQYELFEKWLALYWPK